MAEIESKVVRFSKSLHGKMQVLKDLWGVSMNEWIVTACAEKAERDLTDPQARVLLTM